MALVPDLINKWLGKRLVVKGVILYPGTGLIEDAPTVDGSTGLLLPNGTAAAPSHSFKNDPDTGMYRSAANTLGFAVGGSQVAQLDATQWLVPNGTAALPGCGFLADPNTGIYRVAADNIGVAFNGVAALSVSGAENTTFAAAANTAGQDVFIDLADAGASASATAKAGGAFTVWSGKGSTATASLAGGVGGDHKLSAGPGGASAVAQAAGAGGTMYVWAGDGGVNTGGASGQAGGAGGALNVTAGYGGNTDSTGAHAGGQGGQMTFQAGVGGNASAGTGNGGRGGSILLVPGTGGTSSGGTAGANGAIIERGIKLVKQAAPTAKTTSATLTAAEVLVGLITVNQGAGATSAQQLPTGSQLDAALPMAAADDAFDFTVINTSTVDAEDASITVNTGVTIVGSAEIHARSAEGSLNSSGRFRLRKTGSATWVCYRLAS